MIAKKKFSPEKGEVLSALEAEFLPVSFTRAFTLCYWCSVLSALIKTKLKKLIGTYCKSDFLVVYCPHDYGHLCFSEF